MDRQSNNVSLFNLVEQINVPEGAPAPPRGVIPLEIHAYFQLDEAHRSREFEMRYALRAATGLETLSDVFRQRSAHPRFRVRTLGLPYPPVVGHYTLHVDFRLVDEDAAWQRQVASWPISLSSIERRPRVTH